VNDPHVESLEYRFVSDSTRVFENPPPLEHQTSDFNLRLADGYVTVEMNTHCATEQEARALVDPFLLAWEIDQALQNSRRVIRFEFHKATVIDRQPPPPGNATILAASGILSLEAQSLNLIATASTYPPLPANFVASPDVATLWNRYEGHLLNREPLPGMAYFCLTVIEDSYGGRKKAAHALNVDAAVLNKLGELTSERGDATAARKRKKKPFCPLTTLEERWIHAVVKEMIRRVATKAAGTAPPAFFPMSHLPKLL
jgi:hypothetical protein